MKILHLYYNLMNLYGDYGNLKMLSRVLEQKGETVEIIKADIGDVFHFENVDMIYIGSGTERNQKVMLEHIKPYAESLRTVVYGGVPLLATGNSFEIFGSGISDKEEILYRGLGWFEFVTTESRERTVQDVVCTSPLAKGEIIGFINKNSETMPVKNPMFHCNTDGNSKGDKSEGVIEGNFYGTHLIGPLLVRNPNICEYFANLLISQKKIREGKQ